MRHIAACDLPSRWGLLRLHAFHDASSGREHLALTIGNLATSLPVLTRLHSECLTGETFLSQRCDCRAQLDLALTKITAAGRGIVVYLRQEGRGIGLLNKVRAYQLQDAGADTVEANEALGFGPDVRDYGPSGPILGYFNVSAVRLMTNNARGSQQV